MYAVICNPKYWEEIEEVVSSRGGQILISAVNNSVDIDAEIENAERLPISHIILDISAVQDKKQLLKAISRYRILHEETQIVIIASNFQPGDKTLHSLVTMNVYNIIAPSSELPGALKNTLTDVLEQPYTYKKAVKWLVYNDNPQIEARPNNAHEASGNRPTLKELVGTITISVAGLQHGAGTTYNALMIAKFLASLNYAVAVVELKIKNDYSLIYLPRNKSYNAYSFQYENLDVYANDGEITPDELLIEARSKDYQYIILDTGLLFKYNFEKAALDKPETQIKKYEKGDFYNDFMKTDLKIVNSFASNQYSDSVEYLVSYLNTWEINDLNVLFSFATKDQASSLKKFLDAKSYLTPYNPKNDFTEEQETFYKDLLEKVLPSTKNKGDNFFKKLIRNSRRN